MTTTAEVSTGTNPFVGYGNVLGVLLLGYLFFDRAFAYLHLPGLPVFVASWCFWSGS